jgi:acyl-CoA thioester hydrolase
MGIVYHANYLVWMEVGRVEYFRAAGIRYRDMETDDGIRLAVIEANCRYVSPAHYDDEVVIQTSIVESNRRSVRLSYQMRESTTARKLAEGFTRHLFLSHEMRPAKLPHKYWPLFGIK